MAESNFIIWAFPNDASVYLIVMVAPKYWFWKIFPHRFNLIDIMLLTQRCSEIRISGIPTRNLFNWWNVLIIITQCIILRFSISEFQFVPLGIQRLQNQLPHLGACNPSLLRVLLSYLLFHLLFILNELGNSNTLVNTWVSIRSPRRIFIKPLSLIIVSIVALNFY